MKASESETVAAMSFMEKHDYLSSWLIQRKNAEG